MKAILFAILFCLTATICRADLPYTTALYSYDSLQNILYATDTDYAGNTVDLLLDLYRPKNDFCNRPLLILVHGGSWIAGSKEDPDLPYLARYFVKRGYVVANVNYRLGDHKASSYDMYALCNTSISAPCAYVCDSAEVIRANYRGMQDVRAAIRFLKARHDIDSSDIGNTYLMGESAGAFICLTTAFLNDAYEKPDAAYAISNAPTADADMNTYGCMPASISYQRADLGPISGRQNINGYDASVQGVASLYGAVFDTALISSAELSQTALYLFHQGSDVVVNYGHGRVLGRISFECYGPLSLCQPYYFYPNAFGGKSIYQYALSRSSHPWLSADIVENYEYMNDCFDNGHALDNITLRAQNAANLFAQRIADGGNSPSTTACITNLNEFNSTENNYFECRGNTLFIHGNNMKSGGELQIRNLYGQTCARQHFNGSDFQWTLDHLPAGLYILSMDDQALGRFFLTH